ncbi:hypothetical protein [[Clostridium] fimetarium]|uniref:SH3 domain-containing protein n=1 Tax=[Clostridium] fimetarium TaxID=99656 RepID=A0A1I0PZC2_9FIRM|nr:hypothetical protein [[Clostridium] fimetarium]SEW20002.1 hypothetical protein SAMN05421659_106165 [[Clostridium] fimetarium]
MKDKEILLYGNKYAGLSKSMVESFLLLSKSIVPLAEGAGNFVNNYIKLSENLSKYITDLYVKFDSSEYRKMLENIGKLAIYNNYNDSIFSPSITTENIINVLDSLNINKNENGYITKDSDEISFDEISEFTDDINTVVKSKFITKDYMECAEKWGMKHPILVTIIGIVIAFLLNCMTSKSAITINNTNIYVNPTSHSQKIYVIPQNTKIVIDNEGTRYFYKILYTDVENDRDIDGYVAIKNIRIDK